VAGAVSYQALLDNFNRAIRMLKLPAAHETGAQMAARRALRHDYKKALRVHMEHILDQVAMRLQELDDEIVEREYRNATCAGCNKLCISSMYPNPDGSGTKICAPCHHRNESDKHACACGATRSYQWYTDFDNPNLKKCQKRYIEEHAATIYSRICSLCDATSSSAWSKNPLDKSKWIDAKCHELSSRGPKQDQWLDTLRVKIGLDLNAVAAYKAARGPAKVRKQVKASKSSRIAKPT